MTDISEIVIAIFTVLLLIFAVYFVVYRTAINRKLRKNESTAHISMASPETVGRILAAAGVVIFAVATLRELSLISQELYLMEEVYNLEVQTLSANIRNLNDTVLEHNDVITYISCTEENENTENGMTEVTVKCIPKTYSSDTKVRIILDGGASEMPYSENGWFSVKKDMKLNDDKAEFIIEISNGITKYSENISCNVR